MPGRIRQSDIEEIKARADILEIVGDYVTLKRAGSGSYKGLSPFKDERTPSFHVRPQLGLYHCFSTGKGGDVYSFLQEVENLTFVEAVERVASRIGYEIHYEDSNPQAERARSRRTRILAANQAAAEYFLQRLDAPDADAARRFLAERRFDKAAAEQFGVGYAPRDYTSMIEALAQQGFSAEDLLDAGLTGRGDRGADYPRFRGRLVWPIRDLTGQTVGFGARRLFDEDAGPKYLNTPETQVYRKSQVLYGLDLARRGIGKERRVVIVEGYTDVMACHLAGVTTAVATCGTAFGADHIRSIRRILGDQDSRGEVVFTFDPDAAGQSAALRTFQYDDEFVAQPYVAVGPGGLDPCDLRVRRGDAAVRGMLEQRTPLFEFVIRQTIARHDLETVEGRLAAIRAASPVISGIRDAATRAGYAQQLARLVGMDPTEVDRLLRAEQQHPRARSASPRPAAGLPQPRASEPPASEPRRILLADLPPDPTTRTERDALMAVLQEPGAVGSERIVQLADVRFSSDALAAVRDAIVATVDRSGRPDWVLVVAEEVPDAVSVLARELAFATMPVSATQPASIYAAGIVNSLLERELLRRKAELVGRLQRTDAVADPSSYREIQQNLTRIETERRALRDD